jgi:two-component system OmpR family response regulator
LLKLGARLRILVVEDEPDLRSGLCQALREEDYAVDDAADGEEGLYKAGVWNYDAIVLDIMLPKLGGLELLAALRREKNTPVLLLTARDAVDDRVKGLDAGADDYLVKPFELAELQARLRSLIRRSSNQQTPVVDVGAVSIDTTARQVSLDGKPITFTAREYRLVELLILNRGKLVTRTMIYDHLFDDTHDTMSNIVDVYISRIRAQLGKEFIRTRRGEGYIIDG